MHCFAQRPTLALAGSLILLLSLSATADEGVLLISPESGAVLGEAPFADVEAAPLIAPEAIPYVPPMLRRPLESSGTSRPETSTYRLPAEPAARMQVQVEEPLPAPTLIPDPSYQMLPAAPSYAAPTASAEMSIYPVSGGSCVDIHYRRAIQLVRRRRPSCDPPVHALLCVTNPTTCCQFEVPVCLPACCLEPPCVSNRAALIGDGVVRYEWKNGVAVHVRFQHNGDILVTYHGT